VCVRAKQKYSDLSEVEEDNLYVSNKCKSNNIVCGGEKETARVKELPRIEKKLKTKTKKQQKHVICHCFSLYINKYTTINIYCIYLNCFFSS